MIEEWRPVVGYEGLYEVSDQGRVRSLDRAKRVLHPTGQMVDRFFPGKELKATPDGRGYLAVGLSVDGRTRTKRVHQLMAAAFIGPPLGRQVCHGDGDSTRNILSNLRYGSAQDNSDDRQRHGTQVRGETVQRAILTEPQVREIKSRPDELLRDLAAEFGVAVSTIHHVRAGRTWRHV